MIAFIICSFGMSLAAFIGFVFVIIRMYNIDVELNAMKKSTHKIQWMPIDQAWAQSDQAVNKAFEQDQGHPDDLEGV